MTDVRTLSRPRAADKDGRRLVGQRLPASIVAASALTRLGLAVFVILIVTTIARPVLSAEFDVCPVTHGSDGTPGPPFPEAQNWYGSEALAVVLPMDGGWGITGPTARIAVKLFMWSVGFEPGAEANLEVEIENLDGNPNDAIVTGVTSAGAESLGGWTMLVGIDFPSPGCWRITADYLGQSLSFVVRTVDFSE